MKVTITQKKLFEVKAQDGTVFLMEQAGDSWNGLLHLKTFDGDSLIVASTTEPLTSLITSLFSGEDAEFYVVKGSPPIIAALSTGE